jgi:hypothetical protein
MGRAPRVQVAGGFFHVTALSPCNRRYAQWFNERHDLEGHVVQAPFGSVFIEDDEHLKTVARYVALNPVRAGVC